MSTSKFITSIISKSDCAHANKLSKQECIELASEIDKSMEDYFETYHEVVRIIWYHIENGYMGFINDHYEGFGSGGLYDLAKELTNEFQEIHKETEWGEELSFTDEIDRFFDKKSKE